VEYIYIYETGAKNKGGRWQGGMFGYFSK